MARPRKKYNKMKQLARVADHLVRDKVVCYTDNLKGCVVVDIVRSRVVPPESREGQQVIAALARPHQWSCFIAVFGRNEIAEYMKSEQIFVPAKYFQDDLAPIFEEHHSKLIKGMNQKDLCGVGWIADPTGAEHTEDAAGRVFQQLGVWND